MLVTFPMGRRRKARSGPRRSAVAPRGWAIGYVYYVTNRGYGDNFIKGNNAVD